MNVRGFAPLVLAVLTASACATGPTPTPAPGRIDILIASDLAAVAAPLALSMQQAIQMAIDKNSAIGRYKLGYLPMDDSLAGTANAEKGVQNVKQMIANGRVLGMVGPDASAVAFEEIPVANAAGLVMLSPSNTNSCLTITSRYCTPEPVALRPSGANNYFRAAPPDSLQGRAMARYASGYLHVRKAAAFSEVPAVDDPLIDSFTAELARTSGELVLRQDLAPDTTAFTTFLTMARDRGAQAIYAPTVGDHACVARAQMKQIFPDGAYFMGSDTIYDGTCIKEAADSAEGMFATIPAVDPTVSTDPALKNAVTAYRKQFPSSAITSYSYTFAAYDCALILIDAIKRAIAKNGGNLPTRPQVVDAVAHTQLKGVNGIYFFDSDGDMVSPQMSLYQVRDGKWVYVQLIDASSTTS